jgi:signal transduction histidine kinase
MTKAGDRSSNRAIAADVTQLHQVCMNLFVNARDAMPTSGTLAITAENQHLESQQVRIHPKASANAYVVVRVTDTIKGPHHSSNLKRSSLLMSNNI